MLDLRKSLFIIVIAATISGLSQANWWYLGLKVKSDDFKRDLSTINKNNNNLLDLNIIKYENARYCNNMKILSSPMQRKLCKKNAKLIDIMSRAAKLAIEECQHQFKFKRWNCTIFNRTNIYGGLTQTRSKETAFIYSIYSAAAMYEVTKACSRGELKKCNCNNQVRQVGSISNTNDIRHYQFGGCSDNVLFGYKLSKHFVDSNENAKNSKSIQENDEDAYLNQEHQLMNLHNNEVGRRTILKNMKEVCKCHGVSGSCSVKVCWKVMPDFRKIGYELIKRYNQASQIKDSKPKKRVEKLMILNRRSTNKMRRSEKLPTTYKDNLVFIERSPNFCRRDKRLNTPGTRGRLCSLNTDNKNQTLSSDDQQVENCEYLCCGRGYYSKVIETEEECECEFQWCCSVKCKKCKKKIVQYYCN